jgi:hypothetical protein
MPSLSLPLREVELTASPGCAPPSVRRKISELLVRTPIMTDSSFGHFLIQALSFVTHSLSPEASGALARFMEEVGVVLTAHSTEHLGTREFNAIRKRLLSYAEKAIKPPENHDLQKAFYASFLRATEVMYLLRLEQLGSKPLTVSWVTGLMSHLSNKLGPSSIITLELGSRTEKEALTGRLKRLRSEMEACDHITPKDLDALLPLPPNAAVLNQLTIEAKNRGLEASNEQLVRTLIDDSPWYEELGKPF